MALLRVLLLLLLGAAAPLRAEAPLPIAEIAPGVWLHTGVQQDASAENDGDIANIGFVVGSRCVAVIDSGGSLALGRRLRAAVRGVTPLPVCHVINTHMHPDHVFGNGAFVDDAPAFVGHVRLPAALAARERSYLAALERNLGPRAEGSRVIPPTLLVKDSLELDLGGRVLHLRAWPTAHTDNDLTVYDPASGTLWLSDLLFMERIPVVDGSLRGWLKIHPALREIPATRFVPGHGPPQTRPEAAFAPQERYLRALLDETRAAIRAKRTLTQALEVVGRGEEGKWLLYEGYHRRNVTAAFAELEWED